MKTLILITLSLAVTTIPGPRAAADVLEYQAELNSAAVIAGGAVVSTESSVGTAHLLLKYDPASPALAVIDYEITATGLDFDGNQTPELNDDATAIHFHDLSTCVAATCVSGDTAGTRHVLNVFGSPRVDDEDMQAFPSDHRVTGIWDMTDANMLTPAPSVAPGDILTHLESDELFGMIHSREFPGGAIGGVFKLVPEPSSGCLFIVASGVVMLWRRRSA